MQKIKSLKKGLILLTLMMLVVSTGFKAQAQDQSQKIGLTLSGGGARGLAHIGILHAIDSAGLKVDYITGTSMGSIVGGLYSAGYNAQEIEDFALSLDWESLFSNNPPLSAIHPYDKADYGRRMAEIPFENGRFKLGSGMIESQSLWNILSELFLPVYHLVDFNKFPIPFACVATDVSTGEPIYFHEGDIVTAIRASMAIPSIFTSVEVDGKHLIDGGIARNFPVKLVKEMGADFVIGVNVSQGLRPADELNNVFEIIYQLGFYKNELSYQEDWGMTNLFICPELEGYSAASFNSTKEIIEIGKKTGRKYYPIFKQLADSLGKQSALHPGRKNRLPYIQTITIDSVIYTGLVNVDKWFVRNKVGLRPGATVRPSEILAAVDRLFSTNYFNRVRFHLVPTTQNHVQLIFILDEKASINTEISLNYSSFNGVGIVAKLKHNKLLLYDLRAYIKAEIGDQPDLKTGFSYFWNPSNTWWLNVDFSANRLLFPVYEDFFKFGEYSQLMMDLGISVNRQLSKNAYLKIGNSRIVQTISPKARSSFEIKGSNTYWRTFIEYHHLSLNRQAFPESGKNIELSFAHISNQSPNLDIYQNQEGPFTLEESGITITSFQQLYYKNSSYYTINKNLSLSLQQQLGYNFNYNQKFLNAFNVGGNDYFLRNQMTFSGLKEYQIITPAILGLGLGMQYHLGGNIYITSNVNAGVFDFKIENIDALTKNNAIWGANAGVGYNSVVGPVKVSLSYNPQANKIYGFMSLGWLF